MTQVLFVSKGGQVAFWKYFRGRLAGCTLAGNRWNKAGAAYWDAWLEANPIADGLDAIVLLDSTGAQGDLPRWLTPQAKTASAWTLDLLSKLAADESFDGHGIVFRQGTRTFVLVDGRPRDTYELTSTHAFDIPREEPEVEQEAPKVETGGTKFLRADSVGDDKAVVLEVGKRIYGRIAAISWLRGHYYVESGMLSDQARGELRGLFEPERLKVGMPIELIVSSIRGRVVNYIVDEYLDDEKL